jgi:hypothetical protein
MRGGSSTTGGGGFDALLGLWLAERDGQIGAKLAAEFARGSHPWELPEIHDSLHALLTTKEFARGSRDLLGAAFTAISVEANEAGRVDREALGFFVLTALYAATKPFQCGPTFVRHPLTVAFRMIAAGDESERRWLLAALDAARRSLDTFVDWNGQRNPDESALANLGWTAAREAATGVVDDDAVERVAEELDCVQPPGLSLLFLEHPKRKGRALTQFLDAMGKMLGKRWESPAWQMVRHVLVEPRR